MGRSVCGSPGCRQGITTPLTQEGLAHQSDRHTISNRAFTGRLGAYTMHDKTCPRVPPGKGTLPTIHGGSLASRRTPVVARGSARSDSCDPLWASCAGGPTRSPPESVRPPLSAIWLLRRKRPLLSSFHHCLLESLPDPAAQSIVCLPITNVTLTAFFCPLARPENIK